MTDENKSAGDANPQGAPAKTGQTYPIGAPNTGRNYPKETFEAPSKGGGTTGVEKTSSHQPPNQK